MALAQDVLPQTATFRCGHPRTDENSVWSHDKRDDSTRARCRTCRNDESREREARQRKEAYRAEVDALEALTRVAPDPTSTCKYGHLLTADNLAWDRSGRDGKRRARCQTCKRESVRKSHAKHSKAPTGSMIVPRQTRSGKVSITADQPYATVRLWRLFGPQLRDRVTRALTDEQVDPLQRRVLERAANGRHWVATNSDVAARLYVEALLSETIDARSPMLRIDVLLALIFGR